MNTEFFLAGSVLDEFTSWCEGTQREVSLLVDTLLEALVCSMKPVQDAQCAVLVPAPVACSGTKRSHA